MAQTTEGFAARYGDAFREYLEGGTERSLEAAYELGRLAVTERLSLMDLATAHHDALRHAMEDGHPEALESAIEFFRESLATFELATRAFHDAQEAVRLEQAHAEQQRALADAAMAINERLDPQHILDVVVERACDILHGTRAIAEVRLEHAERTLRAEAGGPAPPGAATTRAKLVGRERALGTLIVEGARAGGSAGAAILDQLGQVASLAIENGQRYQRERHVAETLQRSLLPTEMPEIEGMKRAATYLPAGDGIHVGGDFYDAYRTPTGSYAVVIGDVCGKGVGAASLTALARYTARAATLHERTPGAVLRTLNMAMLEQRTGGRFATVLCAFVSPHPGGAQIVLASGGHPLPLVRRADGRVETIGAGGTLLGVLEEPVLVDSTASLSSGDTLVLFTDGVIEVRENRKELFGPEDLTALLGRAPDCDPEELLAMIEGEVRARSGGRLRDDVALLALKVV